MDYIGFVVYKQELEKFHNEQPNLFSEMEKMIVPYKLKSQVLIGVPVTKDDSMDYDAAADLMYAIIRARNLSYFKRSNFVQFSTPEE